LFSIRNVSGPARVPGLKVPSSFALNVGRKI